MSDLAVLTSFTLALIELLKSSLKAFNVLTSDDQREIIVRWAAAFVGIAVALAFHYDALRPDAPTLAGMVVSGALLAILSDAGHVALDTGKAAAVKLQQPPASKAVATAPEGGTATAQVVAPPVNEATRSGQG